MLWATPKIIKYVHPIFSVFLYQPVHEFKKYLAVGQTLYIRHLQNASRSVRFSEFLVKAASFKSSHAFPVRSHSWDWHGHSRTLYMYFCMNVSVDSEQYIRLLKPSWGRASTWWLPGEIFWKNLPRRLRGMRLLYNVMVLLPILS